MGYRFARFLIQVIIRITSRLEIHGMENIPPFPATFIAASNHLGRLDAPLVYYLLDRDDILLLVAEKYRENPIFHWFVKQLNATYIDRFNADFTTMRTVMQRLKQGCVLVMAPEGTRSPTGALIEARPGASYLAARSGVPVLPVGVTGTEDKLLVKHLTHLRRDPVRMWIGKPFILPNSKGQDREVALKRDTDEIMCQIAALLPPEYRGVYADHPRLKELLAESEQVKGQQAAHQQPVDMESDSQSVELSS